jgi:enoyl-[acyl-carrier protein] reductase III
MYPELNGKHALVTGAARGFGRAIAMRLAAEGATVVVNYRRSKTDANNVVGEIEAAGGKAIALRGDMGNEESLDRLFEEIAEQLGRLDILVANAAFGIPGPLMNSTSKHWDVTMSSSARSLLDLTKRAVPLMTSDHKRIVSITSSGGHRVLARYGLMGIAKGALESLTRSLAVELAPQGILVNGVLAGVADTKSLRSIPGVEDLLDSAEKHTPVGRLVLPEDVADAVTFLVSDQARMICGHFVVVDGGYEVLA